MSQHKGTKGGEVVDAALGAKNIAENLAKENAAPVAEVTPEVKHRGRPASTKMNLAKWTEIVKSGAMTDEVIVVAPEVKDNRYFPGHIEYNQPIVNLAEDGSLSMVKLSSNGRKVVIEPVSTKTPAEVLAFLNSK